MKVLLGLAMAILVFLVTPTGEELLLLPLLAAFRRRKK